MGENNKKLDKVKEFLKIIPGKSGVYIFKDSRGRIIYIGKAKNLYNRVRSYFQNEGKNFLYTKPLDFTKKIKSIDYVVTDNETEALILESTLVKKNKPRYNVELKDDKSYPFIAVTIEEKFPRVFLTRDRGILGAKYFGPYTDAKAVRKTIEYLRKVFKIRDCKKIRPGKGKNIPCLNYYINLCVAPCTGNISPEEYRKSIDLIVLFLRGKDKTVVDKLKSEMEYYSKNREFEKAAELRDKIDSISKLYKNQKIFFTSNSKWDFISTAMDINNAVISLFIYRAGALAVVSNFSVNNTRYLKEGEILSAFIREYYANMDDVPEKIFCSVEVENSELISKWLSEKTGRKVDILIPKIGEKKKIMKMAVRNSILYLEKKKFEKDIAQSSINKDLIRLKELLGLTKIPAKVECYDISNLKNSFPVGSMVIAVDGKLKSSGYRHFRIKTIAGQDDCKMIGEIIIRRLKYLENESSKNKEVKGDDIFYVKPDLIVVDGGKAQFNTVKKILDEKQIKDIDIISIAKKEEVIFCDKYPDGIKLNLNDSYARILIKVRDEAHRFAVKYHRQLRDKNMLSSMLDAVKGIGEKKRKNIFERINSIEELKSMTVEDLAKIKGLSCKDAENIHRNIHR